LQTATESLRLSYRDMKTLLARWQEAWNRHDLDGVIELFDDDVLFDNWTGERVRGRVLLRRAWAPWFAFHRGFRFVEEEILIDEAEQKAVFRWRLEWRSQEEGYRGQKESRSGVDVLHFSNGRIVQKLTYSKTILTIDGKHVPLVARPEAPTVEG
jgi:ketosteroid isomerase-like protein